MCEILSAEKDLAVLNLLIDHDFPVLQPDDSLGMLGDFVFVGHHDDRPALVVEPLEQCQDFVGRDRIEVTGRFVGKDEVRDR